MIVAMELAVAIALALAFSLTNGLLDAANAVATLVATRGAGPGSAIVLAAAFNILGAVVVGTAVASTIAGIVDVPNEDVVAVVGSGVLAATVWNLIMWSRSLPSSSGHALVGGLVGACWAESGLQAVNWGGLHGLRPYGVVGVLISLAVSPVIGFALAALAISRLRRGLRRGRARLQAPVRAGQWTMSAALAFSHGANDGQKAMGVVAALLLATGHLSSFAVPLWVKLACALALTLGTALGGWRIIRTVGRGIYRLTPLDALASETAATAAILGAAYAGAPVSTTQVVASSVVGIGAGRRRFRHVRWTVVREIGFGWLITLPASTALGAVSLLLWRAIA
jgi:PiT family inorganic phosphate transporter